MPRLFWPNFDFEHELARGSAWNPPDRLLEFNSSMAYCFCAVAEEEDVIVVPRLRSKQTAAILRIDASERNRIERRFIDATQISSNDQFHGSEWELIPWGVTQSLKELARTHNWTWTQPEGELVRQLNDRTTSVFWEKQTQTLPEGVEVISSFEELRAAIANLKRRNWVLKARFGMSGRERIAGQGVTLTTQQTGWIERRLKEQGSLVLEPWLERIDEVGIQLQIPQSGNVELLAILPLINSSHGEYQGSRLYLTDAEQLAWDPAIRIATQIAEDVQRRGYFGPLGIDSMRYREGDEVVLRPVQEINARWTMGRIAWEWGRQLSVSQRATWFQGPRAEELLCDPSSANRVIKTSPEFCPTETIIPSLLLLD